MSRALPLALVLAWPPRCCPPRKSRTPWSCTAPATSRRPSKSAAGSWRRCPRLDAHAVLGWSLLKLRRDQEAYDAEPAGLPREPLRPPDRGGGGETG